MVLVPALSSLGVTLRLDSSPISEDVLDEKQRNGESIYDYIERVRTSL